jgi:hypothetical protein
MDVYLPRERPFPKAAPNNSHLSKDLSSHVCLQGWQVFFFLKIARVASFMANGGNCAWELNKTMKRGMSCKSWAGMSLYRLWSGPPSAQYCADSPACLLVNRALQLQLRSRADTDSLARHTD